MQRWRCSLSGCQLTAVGEGTAEVGGAVNEKPPARLVRMVAPLSHPYERGGSMQRLFFVA